MTSLHRIAGRQYGTARAIAAALGPDVTVDMIRKWADPDRETNPITRIRVGHNVYYPLDEAQEKEAEKYLSGRGRPRRLDEPIMAAA
ncbi:hypothetical protein AB0C02_28060 [Micromonospora sp. NPDC048999]|uniref:hypothetical protein n=1 Tax=Micromonospora sp. NPDC048999 TaxID=3155391 RepID=UPI0033ED8F31